ncbi:MAG: zinc ABC transporter substrate-binding protein, partial [Muribaculaceae bacterium]|nr:zinc ABC transporter substrate-binding protein [Muribaculaceae bacterium]
MVRKFVVLALACAVSLSLLCACGRGKVTPEGPMKVTASIAPIAALVEAIGGDSVDVQVLLPQGADAESFEPQIGKLRDLEGASLFAATGLLPFETKMRATLEEGQGARFVGLSPGIDLIRGTHGEGEADPHIWVSVRNLKIMAATLAEAMAQARPSAAGYFAGNHAALDARLDSLDREIASGLALAGSPRFLVWHPSLSYFARDYGLRQISVGFEGKEGSAVGIRDRVDLAMSSVPKVYFLQADEDSRAAETLPVPPGTKKVRINLMATD